MHHKCRAECRGQDEDEADEVNAHPKPSVGRQVEVAGCSAAVLVHIKGVQEPLFHAERPQRGGALQAAEDVSAHRALGCEHEDEKLRVIGSDLGKQRSVMYC